MHSIPQTAQRVVLVGMNMPGYESMALRLLRASLQNDGRIQDLSVATVECTTETDPWWLAYDILGLDPAPTVLCFSLYCWNASKLLDTIRLIATVHPRIPIIVGGPEVGPIADTVLTENPWISGVVCGEGEELIRQVVLSLARDGDIQTIPGLVTHGSIVDFREGKIHPALIDKLDRLEPAYSNLYPPPVDGSAYIETYRGCPHACAYCYEGKGQARVRSYSWERIERDIALVAQTPGLQSVSFIDSVFNLTLERLRKLSDILAPYARQGLMLHTIEVDIESIDTQQAVLLARAGVKSVETGPQTTCAAALDRSNRTFDSVKFRAGIDACLAVGIRVECDVIIGLPGDTVSTVLSTLQYVVDSKPTILQVSTLHVLPGTQLYENADEQGLRFDKVPPHEIIQTEDISYRELRNLEVFGTSLAALYRACL